MPRVNGTRKLRAAELLDTATQGPDMGLTFSRAGSQVIEEKQ